MSAIDPAYRNLIQFVPQKSEEKSRVAYKKKHFSALSNGICTRKFYESLINEDLKSDVISSANNSQWNSNFEGKNKTNTVSKYEDSRLCSLGLYQRCKSGIRKNRISGAKTEHEKKLAFPKIPAFGHSVTSYPVLTRLQQVYSKLLRSAQLGDLEQVSKLLKEGLDINHTDFFGWTPLMCAAKEGHDKVVIHLLTNGADCTVLNSYGQTASMLAQVSGHIQVAQKILHFQDQSSPSDIQSERQSAPEPYFCQVCKLQVSSSEQETHNTSVVHLFNSGHKPKGSAYLIPETNRGFQMLLRTGWEVDKGLGPKGDGAKYPVKTVLKHDRKGFGNESDRKKAKITHFNPNDRTAISHCRQVLEMKTACKAARQAAKAKERRDKIHEHNFRLDLSGGFV